MNVVDSCGWLEFFAGSGNAHFFAPAIEDVRHLVVPTLTLFEVFKRVRQQRGESDALTAIAAMQQGRVVDLTAALAFEAAELSLLHKLPLADSLVLATAHANKATLWTQDSDFEHLPGVRYRAAPTRKR